MDERVSKLEDVVAVQQKTIDTLLDMLELLNKRLDISNSKIDLLKEMTETNVDMIKSSNDTMIELFKLIKGD